MTADADKGAAPADGLVDALRRMANGGYCDRITATSAAATITRLQAELDEAGGFIRGLDCECDPSFSTATCGRCAFLTRTEQPHD